MAETSEDPKQPDWPEELGELLMARGRVAERKALTDAAWAKVVASPIYQAWVAELEARKMLELQLAEIDGRLRMRAVEEYQRTGEKDLSPGLSIRMTKVLTYEDADALRYCKAGLDVAVTFDRKVLENVLFSMSADILPAFVTLTQVPKATFATDLAKALDGSP